MQNTATAVNLRPSMTDDLLNLSDEELMLRYREGDSAAFEQVYSRHKGPLYRYFKRQCSTLEIAEELFQEVWMSIIKSRSNYISSAKFSTYMYTIAHNKLVDFYRRSSNAATENKVNTNLDNGSPDNESSLEQLPAATQQQPEQIFAQAQKRQRLLAAIELLPEAQREVFLLREESGLSLDDIAKITKVHVETAKSRLRYAVKSLSKIIQAGGS